MESKLRIRNVGMLFFPIFPYLYLIVIIISQFSYSNSLFHIQIVSATHAELQDYTYYFVPAPWLSVKLMRVMQCFEISGR